MAVDTVDVGAAAAVEVPRGTATAVTVQNQSDRHLVKICRASSAPVLPAVGFVLKPFDAARLASLGVGEKVWAWVIGTTPTGETVPVYYDQEA